jgi:hypothetical protein
MVRRSGTAHAQKKGTPRPASKLFWCTTPDHDEDWFIVATTARSASRQHEIEEGYGPGTATAKLVCDLPAAHATAEKGWPSDELLLACGAEFVKKGEGRIVRIGERIYGEGEMLSNVAVRERLISRH